MHPLTATARAMHPHGGSIRVAAAHGPYDVLQATSTSDRE